MGTVFRYPEGTTERILARYEPVQNMQIQPKLGGARDKITGDRLSHREIGQREGISPFKVQKILYLPSQEVHARLYAKILRGESGGYQEARR